MTGKLKVVLLSTTLAALSLVPAAGIVTVATVEAAYAKGGNGGGGNGGKGNGGRGSEARGGGSDAKAGGKPSSPGKSGERGAHNRSAKTGGGKDPISSFIRNLSGEGKKTTSRSGGASKARPEAASAAPKRSIAPAERPARTSEAHPRDLGNLNGALNANINAVLAHVRNGNTNGPVGHLAALAVADAALAKADGETLTAEELNALEDATAEAEAALLAFWNKNDDADPETLSDEEQALLANLRTRLAEHEAEIAAAIAEMAEEETLPEGDAACDDAEGCAAPDEEEEIAAAVE